MKKEKTMQKEQFDEILEAKFLSLIEIALKKQKILENIETLANNIHQLCISLIDKDESGTSKFYKEFLLILQKGQTIKAVRSGSLYEGSNNLFISWDGKQLLACPKENKKMKG